MTVLHDVNTETQAQLIARLVAENEALKAAAFKPVHFKVSEKGALSIYGLGRFPVTLYRSQIERLLDHAPAIRSFISANSAKLSVKA
jgi:hypothetical protein